MIGHVNYVHRTNDDGSELYEYIYIYIEKFIGHSWQFCLFKIAIDKSRHKDSTIIKKNKMCD